MKPDFDSQTVSIVLLVTDPPAYELAELRKCVQAALDQDLPPLEVIVVDARGPNARLDFPADELANPILHHVPGKFANRAAMFNAALSAAGGEFLLLLVNDQAAIRLRRSALRTMVMSAVRHTESKSDAPSLVYADYERLETDGNRREMHLCDWHAGRLCDTLDLGNALLVRTSVLRQVGGFDESYNAADLYDARLRLCQVAPPAHIANRYAGSLYSVAAPAKAHNVFDYLLLGKEAQLEMERACTEHLKRVGAYLAPAADVCKLEYSPQEQSHFDTCIASIVTPVNNRPEFIARAIESVQAQTVRNVEYIAVVNGGPDDPTCDEVRRYMEGGDRYVPEKPRVRLIVVDVNNLGLCLNSGIAAARGKYYVQLDSDDRLKPDAVEKLIAVYESDPTIGMVIGSYEVWTLDETTGELHRNEEVPVVTHAEWTAGNGRNNLLRIGGAGAPRSAHIKAIKHVGWFGVNDTPHCRNYGEDYDLVLRISERYTIGRVWDPIYEVIRHSGGTDHSIDSVTIERNENAKDQMRLDALGRRRILNAGR